MEDTGKPEKKYFDAEQANRMLPLVGSIVRDLVEQYQELSERRDRIASGGGSVGPYREVVEGELQQQAQRLQEYIEELKQLGVVFKDFTTGLVDFPTRIDGREAYLCWKLGEPQVAFWHEIDAGFRGRQPLNEELAADVTHGSSDH